MAPLVSVIISTHNHAALLLNCLKALSRQTAPSADFEVIVVNNRSSDNTPQIISQFPQFKSLTQAKLGISYARNRGAKQARGQYLAFIDADALAPSAWIKQITKIINQDKPQIFGGPIYPYFNTIKPHWFKDSYEIRSFGPKSRALKTNEFLSGSNLIIKKTLFQSLGGFDLNLGVKGKTRLVGEETALQQKTRQTKPQLKIYYYPQLKIKHFVPVQKMTLKYRARAYFLLGRSSQQKFNLLFILIKLLLAFSTIIFKLICVFFKNPSQYPFFQNYLVEQIFPHLYWFGIASRNLYENTSN